MTARAAALGEGSVTDFRCFDDPIVADLRRQGHRRAARCARCACCQGRRNAIRQACKQPRLRVCQAGSARSSEVLPATHPAPVVLRERLRRAGARAGEVGVPRRGEAAGSSSDAPERAVLPVIDTWQLALGPRASILVPTAAQAAPCRRRLGVKARTRVRRASVYARGGGSGFAAFSAIQAPPPTLPDVLLTVPAALAAQLRVAVHGATRSAEAHLEGLQARAVRAEEAAGARAFRGPGGRHSEERGDQGGSEEQPGAPHDGPTQVIRSAGTVDAAPARTRRSPAG